MEIYLEFRMTVIKEGGYNNGLTDQDKKDSIRWKIKPVFNSVLPEMEGTVYDIFLIGTYVDPDPDINLNSLIVKAVSKKDSTNSQIIVDTQIGGFVARGSVSNIPLHITTEIVNNLNPMEGGIRAEINGYSPLIGNPIYLAESILEYNIVHTLYEYIPFYCNSELTEPSITTCK